MQSYSLEPANYNDYREFLKNRFDSLKSLNKNYSLLYCAQKSGISKSYLQFLLKKQRHISLDKFPDLARALKLTDDEEYFVYLMICMNSSQNDYVKGHFDSILSRIRSQHLLSEVKGPSPTDSEDKELHQNVLMAVIQTLVRIKGFEECPDWIVRNLKVPGLTQSDVKQALDKLIEIKALERNEEGLLFQREASFYRPDPYDKNGFSIYTLSAQFLATLMSEPNIYKPSLYSSMTLGMDDEHLKKTEKLLTDVHHQLFAFAKESKVATANVFIGNYFLTLAKTKSERGN